MGVALHVHRRDAGEEYLTNAQLSSDCQSRTKHLLQNVRAAGATSSRPARGVNRTLRAGPEPGSLRARSCPKEQVRVVPGSGVDDTVALRAPRIIRRELAGKRTP